MCVLKYHFLKNVAILLMPLSGFMSSIGSPSQAWKSKRRIYVWESMQHLFSWLSVTSLSEVETESLILSDQKSSQWTSGMIASMKKNILLTYHIFTDMIQYFCHH